MKSFQIEMTVNSGSGVVTIYSMQGASSEKSAINKAIKESKKDGYTNPRNIRAFVSSNSQSLVF
jgi:hypothetical protein